MFVDFGFTYSDSKGYYEKVLQYFLLVLPATLAVIYHCDH